MEYVHGQEMELEDCAHMWWLRFAMDRQCRTLACGTTMGTVLVWDPHTLCRRPKAKLKRGPGSKTTVYTLLALFGTHCLLLCTRCS